MAQTRASHPATTSSTGMPLLVVQPAHPLSTIFNPPLFGLGADLPVGTYTRPGDTTCKALPDAGGAPTLIRIGADTADNYDWRVDKYAFLQGGHSRKASFGNASFGCTTAPMGAAASVLRLLDRARALHATAVVVLNGEIDDPQAAAGLVRLIASRYGLGYAQGIYWEIGNAPARWQHFGVPLSDAQRPSEHINCSPDQYAALVTSYTAAIAVALQGATPRIVADDWITNATDQSWTGVVTVVDTQYYPFNAPDSPPGEAAVARSLTNSSRDAPTLDQQLDNLRANLEQYQGGHDVRVFVGEWNLDASPQTTDPFYNSSGQAVFVARLLLHLARSGDGVVMAAWAPPLYGSTQLGPTQAPFINGQSSPGFRVFAALRGLAGSRLLPLKQTAGAKAVTLDALAMRRPDGRLAVAFSNAAAHGALTLRLRLSAISGSATATVQTFSPATPEGATTTRSLNSASARITVPALGVVLLVISG